MNSKNLYYGMIGITCLLFVGLLYSVDLSNGLLVSQSNNLVSLKAKSEATTNELTQLMQDKKDVQKYSGLNTIAESVVPQDKNQAEAIREIVNLANNNGISQISSIMFPPSTLGIGKNVKASSSSLTQVSPVQGITGVYELPITINQDSSHTVPYKDFVNFLSALEQNRRTSQVASITIQPDSKVPGNVSFTLIINEFIKP